VRQRWWTPAADRQFILVAPVAFSVPEHLDSARHAVQEASEETVDASLRQQLRSIDEGLMELTEHSETTDDGVKTSGDRPHGGELESIEEQLVRLSDHADGAARTHVQEARDTIDAYRREFVRDW
jgi:hypothetical protein